MTAGWSVGVVVPARDEEASVRRCLRSVLAAADELGRGVTVGVVVVADRCRDATAGVASAVLARSRLAWSVVTTSAGSAGSARRTGVRALEDLLGAADPHRTWLATTDADTRVPVGWLARMLALAQTGYDGVAGTVRVDRWDEHPASVRTAYEAMQARRLLPGGRHSHVYGANLGVRLSSLRAVGGMPTPAAGEDAELWTALRRAGFRLAAPADLVAVTSGRRQGRARGGLADLLVGLGG